jgi:hypothetical protein
MTNLEKKFQVIRDITNVCSPFYSIRIYDDMISFQGYLCSKTSDFVEGEGFQCKVFGKFKTYYGMRAGINIEIVIHEVQT